MGQNNSSCPIHNLPKQNRFFTGRENELNQLTDLINSNNEVALSGMAGIGKTQTAIEFCYRQIPSNSYQTILWINAENEANFNSSYYSVVDLLNLASSSSDADGAGNEALKVEQVISLVKRWLANNHNWLIALDNLEDPKLIKNYLPPQPKGHILITTRSQSLKGQAAIVQLKKMSIETGTLFLLKRSNLIPIDANNLDELKADNKVDDGLIADAQKIVQAMDGLPLALEQAGAYIQESKCSLADYLKAYEDTRNTASILDNDGEDPNDHKSVYATFKLNFDVVKEKSMAAAKLLEVCSFLDGDLIPEEIFTHAGSFLGDELAKLQDNNYEFNNCIKILLNYSLIERNTNNKSLSIHRLVQSVIKESIDEQNKKLFVLSLVNVLHAFCLDDPEDYNKWPHYQILLSHLTTLFKFIKFYNLNTLETADLIHQIGIYCQTQSLFKQALNFLQFSLPIYEQLFSHNHIVVANIFHNMGTAYHSQGLYGDASDSYKKSLFISKSLFGNNHLDVAKTLTNLGNNYSKQSQLPEALRAYQEALSIYQHFFPDNRHLDIAKTFNNIGETHRLQGQHDNALYFYNQAQEIYELLAVPFHPDLASVLNNIGIIYDSKKIYDEALDYYQRAFSIYHHLFGDIHPHLATILQNVAAINHDQKNHDLALIKLNKALSIRRFLFGDNHPDVANNLWALANVFANTSNELKATEHFRVALQILDKFLPYNHPNIIELLKQYSKLLIKIDKNQQALPLLDRLNKSGHKIN